MYSHKCSVYIVACTCMYGVITTWICYHYYCRPRSIPSSWIRILTAVMVGGVMLQHLCQKRRLQPTLQPATREPYRNSNSPSPSPTRVYVVCVHVCVTTSNAKFSASSFQACFEIVQQLKCLKKYLNIHTHFCTSSHKHNFLGCVQCILHLYM